MARLKYMIKNLESSILIPHQGVGLIHNGMSFTKCLLQNASTIPWDFLFCILCNLGKFKRNYEYNLSLIIIILL